MFRFSYLIYPKIKFFFQYLIVTGGGREDESENLLDTTEVYSFRDNAWTEAGKLPVSNKLGRAATINNRVLLFGKK